MDEKTYDYMEERTKQYKKLTAEIDSCKRRIDNINNGYRCIEIRITKTLSPKVAEALNKEVKELTARREEI